MTFSIRLLRLSEDMGTPAADDDAQRRGARRDAGSDVVIDSLDEPAFRFQHRYKKLDWAAVSAADVDGIIAKADAAALRPLVDTLAFSQVTAEEVRAVPPEAVARVLRLSQLTIEALLADQAKLHDQLDATEDSLERVQDRAAELDAEAADARKYAADLKRSLREQRKSIGAFRKLLEARGPAAAIPAIEKHLARTYQQLVTHTLLRKEADVLTAGLDADGHRKKKKKHRHHKHRHRGRGDGAGRGPLIVASRGTGVGVPPVLLEQVKTALAKAEVRYSPPRSSMHLSFLCCVVFLVV